ncbi:hypothetical protein VTJ49DRAFT_164 [Mycothermus thermophilus]|uniref:Uncharacterized protein n=1 Tax=Humicola insolens TaxID=85995 RepID=A0ABR3VG19_HUMIN
MSNPQPSNRAKRKANAFTTTINTSSSSRGRGSLGYDDDDPDDDGRPQDETVGTLLAAIATCMNEALRILMFADKRHWGPDEFEQTRALEDALDEAKKDFQEMGPLVGGRWYYEHDRTPDSLRRLSHLLTLFSSHTETFHTWARQGGPINPSWTLETNRLRRLLHRAQCRAAGNVFAATTAAAAADTGSAEGRRCLGAFLVRRRQLKVEAERARREKEREGLPAWQRERERQQSIGEGMEGEGYGGGLYGQEGEGAEQVGGNPGKRREGMRRRGSLEELIPTCNAVGRFRVFRGDVGGGGSGGGGEAVGEEDHGPRNASAPLHDAAFVCDFCDGHIVWRDLQTIPSERAPLAPTAVTGYPHWQARGVSFETGEEKTVVFPPLAIANHIPPEPGEWQAALVCPFCDEATYVDEGEDSSEMRYVQDEAGFPDLDAFQAHLEWYHTALPVPPISSLASALPSAAEKCAVM